MKWCEQDRKLSIADGLVVDIEHEIESDGRKKEESAG